MSSAEKKEVANEKDSGKETMRKRQHEKKNQDNMMSLETREESTSLKVTTVSNAEDGL